MEQRKKEILAGLVMVILFISLAFFIQVKSGVKNQTSSFVLYADFAKSDGLMLGADVRLAGIKIGQLSGSSLNPNYTARLKMTFIKPIELSTDTSISIETDGLLGSKYLEIVPGGEENLLKSGEVIVYTQDALILDELLDKLNTYMRTKKQEASENEKKSN